MIRSRLYALLDRLGPEAVARGLESFTDPTPDGIGGCFLARVYGDKYAFVREWFAIDSHEGFVPLLAERLELPQADVLWALRLFDTKKELMERLVFQWLAMQDVLV